MRWATISALIASLLAFSGCDDKQDTAKKTTVSPREVYERRADEKVLIIDVRTPAEFRQERIEQAVNKPLDEIDKWVNELPKDNTNRTVKVHNSPLLEVPPASRGEPRGARGFSCFARGTEPHTPLVPPARRGNLKEGVINCCFL